MTIWSYQWDIEYGHCSILPGIKSSRISGKSLFWHLEPFSWRCLAYSVCSSTEGFWLFPSWIWDLLHSKHVFSPPLSFRMMLPWEIKARKIKTHNFIKLLGPIHLPASKMWYWRKCVGVSVHFCTRKSYSGGVANTFIFWSSCTEIKWITIGWFLDKAGRDWQPSFDHTFQSPK